MPPPPLKKQRVLSFSSTPNIQRSPASATAAILKPPAPVTTTKRVPAPPVVPVAVTAPPAPAKRFKPLVVHKAKVPVSASSAPMTAAASPSVPVSVLAIAEEALSSIQDFEASVPALRPITLPPSLAQRKRVHRWAVILSGLSNEERAVCALVSRAFRYAGTLMASCIRRIPVISSADNRLSVPLRVVYLDWTVPWPSAARRRAAKALTGDDEHVAVPPSARA